MSSQEKPQEIEFPVVGIGASAGGITALQSLFKTIPSKPNLAFVVVQHLLPDKPSQLPALLANWTSLKVREVRDGLKLERDCVFVAPPGQALMLKGGVFETQPVDRAGTRVGIDIIDSFFESLADDLGSRATAVVLSGTGMDGSAGAVRVKQAGGMVLVQEPVTAMHDGMPTAAIANGAADHVMPLGSLAQELVASGAPGYVRSQTARTWADDVTTALDSIITLIRIKAGFDLTGYKTTPLLWRIQRRMELRRVPLFRDYEALLHDDAAELETLIRGIPIHVTEFFRDAPAWETLQDSVIPRIFEQAGEGPVRAWTPACATGEEAYSLAMLLAEQAGGMKKPRDFQVFATDAAADVLARASRGIFRPSALETLSPDRRQRFFYAADGALRVKRTLREKMVFAPQDVLADPPFAGLDLVTCRNLLIYLEPDAASHVIYLLHSALRVGGYLLLGRGEIVPPKLTGFKEIAPGSRIYCKIGEMPKSEGAFPKRPQRLRSPRSSRSIVDGFAHEAAAEKQDLPAVLIDQEFRVIRLFGDMTPFLRFKSGEPTTYLLDLLQPAMADRLESSVLAAHAQGRAITVSSPVDPATGEHAFDVRVTPSDTAEDGGYRLLVSFIQNAARRGDVPVGNTVRGGDAMDWSEALRLSHEELESSREELQALNEELRASNDQLNLANDDLSHANTQLTGKIEELETQSNVLSAGEVMTLFLDGELRVRWFTPAINALFPLAGGDAGRPITDFAPRFDYAPFLPDVRHVMRSGEPREAEICSADGRWYLKRIRPFRAGNGNGVAITFTDITDRKRAEVALRESEQMLTDELRTMTRLHELADRLLAIPDLSEGLGEVLDTAVEVFHGGRGTVQILGPDGDSLNYAASRGFDMEMLAAVPPITRDFHSTCAACIRTGGRIVASDIASDPVWAAHAPTAGLLGYGAAVSTPLKTRKDELLGVMTVHFAKPFTPSESELRWFDLFARSAAQLIERARAEAAMRKSELRLQEFVNMPAPSHGFKN